MASAQTHLEKVATGGRGKFPGKFGEILHIPNGGILNFPISSFGELLIYLGKFLISPLGKFSIREFPYFPIIAVKFPNGNVEFPHWGNWISPLGKINEFLHMGNQISPYGKIEFLPWGNSEICVNNV